MNKKKHFWVLFPAFLIGMGSVLVWRVLIVKRREAPQFSAQQSSFSLQPPLEALSGELIAVAGKVEKQSREADEFVDVDEQKQIIDGEKLRTEEKSEAEIDFSGFARLRLGPNTEINLTSLLASSFVVNQKQGTANYKLLQDENPLSVRILHLLLNLNSGEAEVTIENKEITIEQLSGKSKFSLVDTDNKTHVWELEQGQKALINDAQRRVEIE